MNAIEKAGSVLGSQAMLAEILKVTPATVSQWRCGIRKVPMERCSEIECATKGQVTCEELRPDLAEHWAYLRGTKKVVDQPEQEAA